MRKHGKTRRPQGPPLKAVEAELVVEEIGAHGDGVARLDGEPVFVPYAAPGDRVRARVIGARAEVLEALADGPDRTPAPCGHYGRCGGCALQHVSEAFYLDWKRARIIAALGARGFDDPPVAPVRPCPLRSRRRAVFAVRKAGRGATVGFHRRGTRDVVALSECHILHPDVFAARHVISAIATRLPAPGPFTAQATLAEAGLDLDLSGDFDTFDLGVEAREAITNAARGADLARLTLNREPFAAFRPPEVRFGLAAVVLPSKSFLQATADGEAALRALIDDAVDGARAVVDLFAGCGTFSLSLAERARVHAVEGDAEACAALDAAARRADGLQPVSVERRDLFLRPLTAEELNAYDAVVVDPPRAGAPAQAAEIARSRVSRVAAVSCNPATFARDARILVDGGYRLKSVRPVDQFLYSPHIELVGSFERG